MDVIDWNYGRLVEHIRVVPAAAADVPEPDRPIERRRGRHVPAQTRRVQEKSTGLRQKVRHRGGAPRAGTSTAKTFFFVEIFERPSTMIPLRQEAQEAAHLSSDSESSMSDFSEDEAHDMEL